MAAQVFASAAAPTRLARPVLTHSNSRGGSYLLDHQQYRAPQPSANIDDLLESSPQKIPNRYLSNDSLSGTSSTSIPKVHSISPSSVQSPSSIKVIDSGMNHTLTHSSCQQPPGSAPNFVATLFYKQHDTRAPGPHPDSSLPMRPSRLPSNPPPAPGSAPTTDLEQYPLEPPPPGPEPLDHLYGDYVTPMCLAHFLQLLDSLQKPYAPVLSSHRCLDSSTHSRVVEIVFGPAPKLLTLADLRRHESIWRFEQEWNVEVVLQVDDVWRKCKRMVVFDMDSTLIQQETVDELVKAAGPAVEEQVKEVTARAMNGELDFEASLRARVALLKGIPADVFDVFKQNMTITPGAKELCQALKCLGITMVVISGGFETSAQYLAHQLGIEHVHANTLGTSQTPDGTLVLNGEVENRVIVDGKFKSEALKEIAASRGIGLQQVIAVGDGANDLPMLRTAGLGVAMNAKPRVQLEAPTRLNCDRMDDLLYLMGYTNGEVDALLQAR